MVSGRVVRSRRAAVRRRSQGGGMGALTGGWLSGSRRVEGRMSCCCEGC
jgi:hypothetical protein